MDAATLTTAQRQRAAALIGDCSIELSPRDEFAGEALRKLLAPGTSVFVNHPSSVTHHDIVAACARLHRAGFVPVPHVAARRLASFTQASDFLQRAAGEAGVERILLIGGDDSPVGPFRASLDLLATGVRGAPRHRPCRVRRLSRRAIRRSMRRTLDAALQAKVALARQSGLACVAGDAVRLRGRADPALDRRTARTLASTARCMSASPDRPAWRRWRSSRSAAASVRRCARWRAATRRSRASWWRPGRMR